MDEQHPYLSRVPHGLVELQQMLGARLLALCDNLLAVLLMPVSDKRLRLSRKAQGALCDAGVQNVGQLIQMSDEELLGISTFTQKNVAQVEDALDRLHLWLDTKLPRSLVKLFPKPR